MDIVRSIYLPRNPTRNPLYRLFDQHFDRYLLEYEDRYEHRFGPLRHTVRLVVEEYLDCGRLHNGFARIRCPSCRGEHLLAFSCQTRNFCPSCQAKRGALFAEHLADQVLAPVPHRHVVFTIPKALRGLFRRERKLLGLLSRCAHDSVSVLMAAYFEDGRRSVGTVASLQTFGSYAANFHPHVHALITDGVFAADGSFERIGSWDVSALSELYRRKVLASLRRQERLSEEFQQVLLSWVHSGFNVHAGHPVLADDIEGLEHLARYITRAPMRLDAIAETTKKVIVRTPLDPRTGKKDLELDPIELIHRLTQQIPAPRQHLVRYYGWYSNRTRGARSARAPVAGGGSSEHFEAPPELLARRRSWARLLRRIFEVDPLLCPRCEVEMKIVSVLTEPRVVDRILRHVEKIGGNDPFQERAPPAA